VLCRELADWSEHHKVKCINAKENEGKYNKNNGLRLCA
jgi:hypothetical protein